MDIQAILTPIIEAIISFLANPIITDVLLLLFLLIMGLSGKKRGYWFGLWNLLLSVITLAVVVFFFLDLLTSLIPSGVAVYFVYGEVDLTKTFAMFLAVSGVLLLGWIIFGAIYLLFTPIKLKNYSYRAIDPMVMVKVNGIGFMVGVAEGFVYVLLFNVVLKDLATYVPTIFVDPLIATLLETFNPDRSIVLNLINSIIDYRPFFNLR
jgi:hypothetical protein